MSQDTKLQEQKTTTKAEAKSAPAPKAPEPTGLPLRDWMATAALQGLLARPGASTNPQDLAAESYALADAMLAARPKGEA